MTSARRCIYHVPYPLDPSTTFGGQVRANRMASALADWGEVWTVAGDAAERRRAMARVREAMARGVHFDFCYSESSTMPTALTESHHLPTHPLLDFAFLRHVHRSGIPVGLFYRDIYWKFPLYGQGVSRPKQWFAKAMYHYDLLAYRAVLDVLFLPSLRMGEYVDVGTHVRKIALPPGHDIDVLPEEVPAHPVSLFYVGGVGQLYRLHELVAAVTAVPSVRLTICTRKDGWDSVKSEYEPLLGPNTQVVHANGKEALAPYFAAANVAVMALEPSEYRDFAAPLKLFEYIGNGKPILATQGCLAGDLVESESIGWTVRYERGEIEAVLRDLDEHPALIDEARRAVLAVRDAHTWDARVAEIAETLASVDRRGSTTRIG